jgi:hypothetical protein
MNDAARDKPKLWPEGLRLMRAHRLGWLPYALLFMVILTPAVAWQISLEGPYHQKIAPYYQSMFEAIRDGKDMQDIATVNDQIEAVPKPSALADLAPIAINLLSLYFFCVYFLSKAPVLATPKASLRGLCHTVLKLVQKYIIVFGPPFILLAVNMILLVANLPPLVQALLSLVCLTAMVVCGGYFFCRYTLVLPLAVSGVKPALKASGDLTKDNIGRLVWGYAVVTTIMLPPALVGVLMPALAGTPDLPHLIGFAALVAASQIAIDLLFVSFGCAVFTMLYSEKQAADPSFKLLTSTSES